MVDHRPAQTAAAPLPGSTARTERAQQAVDAFVDAGRRGDRAAAAAVVSDRDQAFAGRAAVWAANLHRIDWSTLSWTVQPREIVLPAARRSALGRDAWVQEVRIAWSLPGETAPAESTLWLTFVQEPHTGGGDDTDSVTRLAGDGDRPSAADPVPVWQQQSVQLRRAGRVRVLAAGTDSAGWLDLAQAAQRAAVERIGVARRDEAGVLVLEVPRSRAVFERSLGVPAGSHASVAAAAWPMADSRAAPIHVVINPESSRRLSRLGREVLLTHEAVHVATRSPGSPAPTWLVEGYADRIAYQAYPAGRTPAERTVREAVRDRGAPEDWPSEADFAPDATDLDLGYDLAWTATRSIADAYGNDGLNRFYARVDRGATLEEAAAALGTTERQLLERWRSDLRRMAGRA